VFIDGRSFKLLELGAGIAQFILVLANVAIRKPSFVFIDEPELNLHPSLQIDFLTTLASYSQNGVVFATHSIGLARAMAKPIYSLRKVAQGETEVRDLETTPRLSEFLGELGFSGYQDLGFNTVLLVEGPTDVTTFQQFLRTYKKDHKIVILPLGGKSFITPASEPQLAELRRISDKIVAIVDSERESATAPVGSSILGFEEVCRNLGIACHILERRATENYFPSTAIKRAFEDDKLRPLSCYEDFASVLPRWHKRENWRIAREMTRSDLDASDLGPILDSL
jgi:hypothetical protein